MAIYPDGGTPQSTDQILVLRGSAIQGVAPASVAGPAIHDGTVNPAPTDGNTGDLWINGSAQTIWIKTPAGWVQRVGGSAAVAPGQISVNVLGITATSATITIAPPTVGTPPFAYSYLYRVKGSSDWNVALLSSEKNTLTLYGLTPATPYEAETIIANGGGSTTAATLTFTTAAQTAAVTLPGAPSISVPPNSITQTGFTVNVTAPTTGGAATQYQVQIRQTGTSTWATIGNATTVLPYVAVSNQTAGTEYDLRAAAVNLAGAGPYSSIIQVTTAAPSTTSAPPPSATGTSPTPTSPGPDPSLVVPASMTIAPGKAAVVPGIYFTNSYASGNAGTLYVEFSCAHGTIQGTLNDGTVIANSGTADVVNNLNWTQLSQVLNHLSYTAGSANDALNFNIWDQQGRQFTATTTITVSSSGGGVTPTTNPGGGVAITTGVQSRRAYDFVDHIGINALPGWGTKALSTASGCATMLNTLGIKYCRVCPSVIPNVGTSSSGMLHDIAAAVTVPGFKFLLYGNETSPAYYSADTTLFPGLASLAWGIEGPNEPDNGNVGPASSTGLETAGAFIAGANGTWAVGQSLGLPVVCSASGGVEFFSQQNFGDMRAVTNYANAHVYCFTYNPAVAVNPASNNVFDFVIGEMWGNGTLPFGPAGSKPFIITETGYWTSSGEGTSLNSKTVHAKYILTSLFKGWRSGASKTFIWMISDMNKFGSGTGDGIDQDNYGLFTDTGTAKAAATAVAALISLLTDSGATAATFTPGALSYTLSGLPSNEWSCLLSMSDGSYRLVIGNDIRLEGGGYTESVSPTNVTLTLGTAVSSWAVYDPMSATPATATASGTSASSITIASQPWPLIVKLVP